MIRLSRPFIGKEEIEAVVNVLKTDQLSLGPKTEEFEKSFAKLIGTKYGIAVNSGTSGLHLAVKSLGIKDGDEVITSPFSFIASANCALFERAIPVFVDVEETTFNMDPKKIEEKITPKTKAIVVVHIFGKSCDMDYIIKIAKKHNLKIIEDACESPLARYKGKNVGSFGDVSVFAFYPNKPMTTGEGGMILTDNKEIAKLCTSYKNQGRGDSLQWLTHERLGYNYRISEITAAIGVEQTKKLPAIIEKRRKLAEIYINGLKDIPGLKLPSLDDVKDHAWFVFPIRVDSRIRDKLIAKLNEKGIQSKAYFYPCIHLQELYKNMFGYKEGDFPIAEKLSKETLIIPFYTQITDKEILTIKESLINSLGELK